MKKRIEQLEYQDLQTKKKTRRKPKLKVVIVIFSVALVLYILSSLAFELENRLQKVEDMQSVATGEKSVITVFFYEDVSESETEIARIGEILLAHPEVSEIVYVSGQQAWEEFKEAYFEPGIQVNIGLNETNPLIHSNHFRVFIHRREASTFTLLFRNNHLQRSIDELAEFAEGIEGVRFVSHMRR